MVNKRGKHCVVLFATRASSYDSAPAERLNEFNNFITEPSTTQRESNPRETNKDVRRRSDSNRLN